MIDDRELKSTLHKSIKWILKPIVVLLIKYQITLPALVGMLKALYVEVAMDFYRLDGKPQTDSRIHLLTGVHRKDIRVIKQQKTETLVVSTPEKVSLGMQILNKWMTDSRFLDSRKLPKKLPVSKVEHSLCFEQLVSEVSGKDIRARSVLDEWLSAGLVCLDQRGYVCLQQEAFVPQKGLCEKVFFWGRNAHDHIQAGVENIIQDDSPFFDRSVAYTHLSAESLKVIEQVVRDESMKLLKVVNNMAAKLQEQDKKVAKRSFRFNFGAYFYHDMLQGKKRKADDEAQ